MACCLIMVVSNFLMKVREWAREHGKRGERSLTSHTLSPLLSGRARKQVKRGERSLGLTHSLTQAIGYSDTDWNWELLFLVVDSVAVLCLFYGIRRRSAALLQPFVLLSVSFHENFPRFVIPKIEHEIKPPVLLRVSLTEMMFHGLWESTH